MRNWRLRRMTRGGLGVEIYHCQTQAERLKDIGAVSAWSMWRRHRWEAKADSASVELMRREHNA